MSPFRVCFVLRLLGGGGCGPMKGRFGPMKGRFGPMKEAPIGIGFPAPLPSARPFDPSPSSGGSAVFSC